VNATRVREIYTGVRCRRLHRPLSARCPSVVPDPLSYACITTRSPPPGSRSCCVARGAEGLVCPCSEPQSGVIPDLRILGETISGRGAHAAESPALRGFHGPGRTRTSDLRIMSYVSGRAPWSAEAVFRTWKCPKALSSRQFGRYFGRRFPPAPVLPGCHPTLSQSCFTRRGKRGIGPGPTAPPRPSRRSGYRPSRARSRGIPVVPALAVACGERVATRSCPVVEQLQRRLHAPVEDPV
jgi:hypothetical protein